MVFLDSTGFLAMVGLLAQCGVAWLLVGVFALLGHHRPGPAWSRQLLCAFAGLAVGLSVMSLRFFVGNAGQGAVLQEGTLWPRITYAIYHACKMLFVWQLLAAIAAIAGRPPLRRWWPAVLLPYGTLTGALASSVEAMLLWQIAVVVPLMAWGGVRLLRVCRVRRDPGSGIAGAALVAWSILWALYAGPMLRIVADSPGRGLWVSLARLSSFCDLLAQTALGAGMIVLVLYEAHEARLVALAERDRMRDALARDQRLRAIGTLVSGVAHELNNPLTAVLGYADDLGSADAEVRRHAAQVVREQAERCRGIVKNLSILAGQRPSQRQVLHVAACVDRVVRGFGPQLQQARLEMRVDCAADLPALLADPVAIEQVLSNLIANAIQATPAEGCIAVTAVMRGGQVEVAVSDTGSGVLPEVRNRLFEPFFTTKETGAGTGLGLALARALVRAHGGDLRLEPSSAGARFVFTVPVALSERGVPAPLPAPGVAPGGLRLLVVDDEVLVRQLIGRFAVRRGWEVKEVASAEGVFDLLTADPPPFDAIVCDLRMPGLSGIELHDRLQREAPALLRRFVFITGDLASPDSASFAQRCACPLVAKPFDLKGLLRAVEKVVVAA